MTYQPDSEDEGKYSGTLYNCTRISYELRPTPIQSCSRCDIDPADTLTNDISDDQPEAMETEVSTQYTEHQSGNGALFLSNDETERDNSVCLHEMNGEARYKQAVGGAVGKL
jgi:hypothetical protein